MGFSRQEYWSGLPFPFQGIVPTQELNLRLLRWQADSLPRIHLGSPGYYLSHAKWDTYQFYSELF